MIRPGLCSVTFRGLTPEALVALAARNGVEAIEWGGDLHVPPGDVAVAETVRALCAERGVVPSSYGSYVRAGTPGCRQAFAAALTSAKALGAGNIRVWAGDRTRSEAGAAGFDATAADLAEMAQAAAGEAITVCVEYHRNTLTEEAADARDLFLAADHANLFSYWQPVPGRGRARWLEELALLQPWLGDLHVFYWIMTEGGQQRRPLGEGLADWRALFDAWQPAPQWPHPPRGYLEFVQDDAEAQFLADMRDLRRLCQPVAA